MQESINSLQSQTATRRTIHTGIDTPPIKSDRKSLNHPMQESYTHSQQRTDTRPTKSERCTLKTIDAGIVPTRPTKSERYRLKTIDAGIIHTRPTKCGRYTLKTIHSGIDTRPTKSERYTLNHPCRNRYTVNE
ncbi:hypothetical protein CHS0354_034457 [Potamilus streckersoni]|uniref:Uncharacterized protein n=1 Tax=Potamilus streckersoni TaxID=2493646 RepID=A0AAE0RLN6_9BIVA|nr:hypothetical protein CHS0354_034457 [Potamilus streckersoni]